MKRTFLFFVLIVWLLGANGQTYWQQKVDYLIDVTLNDKEKTLDAFEKITYTNNSPDTLSFIWFHLWPNAYKNDRTAFSDQLLENGNTSFYFADKEQRGYINKLNFKIDNVTAKVEDHPSYIDVVKLLLPTPLAPDNTITITTPFHVKLPFNFSRGGYDGESFQITQWYPKPAVYDRYGWHPMPYLDQGEFYSEFGNFDVRITVPQNYVVAATGELQNEDEKQWLIRRKNEAVKSYNVKKAPVQKPVQTIVPTKTLNYKQANVHDFAWFANKDFIVDYDTCNIADNVVEVFSFYTPAQKEIWKNSIQYANDALHFYAEEVGLYPYKTASVVQGSESFGGGMEYPTITVISPSSSAKELDITIAHELGHNWFYGILASNERQHPWMDEGMNSFYEYKYTSRKYGKDKTMELLFQTKAFNKTDQPIETRSEDFSQINYGLVAYHKTAEWMKFIEQKLGEEGFKEMMHEYFEAWKFKHPQPEDFKTIAAKRLGDNSENIFSLLTGTGVLPSNKLSGSSFITPFVKGSIKRFLQSPTNHTTLLLAEIGYNTYNKLMFGALLSNYKLPPQSFQYLFIPMYATGSRDFAGLAKLNYSIRANSPIRKTDFFINAARFAKDQFVDSSGKKWTQHFLKLVPGVKFTFREASARSTTQKYLQWKTFFINEQSLDITRDTLLPGLQVKLKGTKRYINQLQFAYQNFRSLYPYDVTMQLEQADGFLRPTITTNYFFNYPSEGGLQVRIFAGKFIYTNGRSPQNKYKTDRFQLNMSGPNGLEDYTYSDYFVGRNDFQNLWSQQMMIRDGGFKIRTDLLSSNLKPGRSDNWLIASNFTTTIPTKINPLSVLPIKLPLRLFADVGTYAEAWQQSEKDRFLFDAGLQLSLFGEAVNFYFPIIYSGVFRDYVKSYLSGNTFWKTMTFSINFYTRDIKKINREIEF